jgi:hypothetical protein
MLSLVAVTVAALVTKSGDPVAAAISARGFSPLDWVLQVTDWLEEGCSVRFRMIRSGSPAFCSWVVMGKALISDWEHPTMRSSTGSSKSWINLELMGVRPRFLELKSILNPFLVIHYIKDKSFEPQR